MKSVNFYFVRHGETIFNHYRRLQGWSDSPLTDKGFQDAKDAMAKLAEIKFENVYCSDTQRAIKTSKIINDGNKYPVNQIFQLSNFREQRFGYFEGDNSLKNELKIYQDYDIETYTFNHVVKTFGLKKAIDAWEINDPFDDAETYEEIVTRLKDGLKTTFNNATNESNILVISHANLIRVLANLFDNTIDISHSPKNGSLTKLKYCENISNSSIECYGK